MPFAPSETFLLCRIKAGSRYADRLGESYHFFTSTPNARKVREGALLVFDRKDESGWLILGYGAVGRIERVRAHRRTKWGGRATDIHAFLADWTPFSPPLPVSPDLAAAVKSLPGYNAQLAIREISPDIFSKLIGTG